MDLKNTVGPILHSYRKGELWGNRLLENLHMGPSLSPNASRREPAASTPPGLHMGEDRSPWRPNLHRGISHPTSISVSTLCTLLCFRVPHPQPQSEATTIASWARPGPRTE